MRNSHKLRKSKKNIHELKRSEILFYLVEQPRTLDEVTAFVYRGNEKVTHKVDFGRYRCKSCKRELERERDPYKRVRCNTKFEKSNKRCNGSLELLKPLGWKRVVKKGNRTYVQGIERSHMDELENLRIVRGHPEYTINLEGIFAFLAERNSRFNKLVELDFHKGEMSDFILKLFREHLKGLKNVVKDMSQSKLPLEDIDITKRWRFFDVFESFINYYGRKYWYLPQTKEGVKGFFAKFVERRKDAAKFQQFMLKCWYVWWGSLDSAIQLTGDMLLRRKD